MGKTVRQAILENREIIYPLDQEDIDQHQYPDSDLFYLGPEDDVWGPFHRSQLFKLLSIEHELDSEAFIMPLNEVEWTRLFEHPWFTRRSKAMPALPKVVKLDALYVMLEGQKSGPFSLDEVRTLLNDKKILVTNLATFDDGQTWIKLYQIPDFDRRKNKRRNESHLPYTPEAFEAKENIDKSHHKDEQTLVEIAKLGQISRDQQKAQINLPELPKEQLSYPWKIWIMSFLSFACVGMIFYVAVFSGNPLDRSKTPTPTPTVQSTVPDFERAPAQVNPEPTVKKKANPKPAPSRRSRPPMEREAERFRAAAPEPEFDRDMREAEESYPEEDPYYADEYDQEDPYQEEGYFNDYPEEDPTPRRQMAAEEIRPVNDDYGPESEAGLYDEEIEY